MRDSPLPGSDPFADVADPFVANGDEVDAEEEAIQVLSSQGEDEVKKIEAKVRHVRFSQLSTLQVTRKLRQAAHQRSTTAKPPISPRKSRTTA